MDFITSCKSIFKLENKSIFDVVIEKYAPHLIKSHGKYLRKQINALCVENRIIKDSYAVRSEGYYTLDETIKIIEHSTSETAKQITSFINFLCDDNDFIVIDHEVSPQTIPDSKSNQLIVPGPEVMYQRIAPDSKSNQSEYSDELP